MAAADFWPATFPLQHSLAPSPPVTSQTSPGKLSHFRMISGVSTQPLQQLQPSVCCATSTRQLCLSIRFLSVCTILCSPAYFRPRLAANALAACYAPRCLSAGKTSIFSVWLPTTSYFRCRKPGQHSGHTQSIYTQARPKPNTRPTQGGTGVDAHIVGGMIGYHPSGDQSVGFLPLPETYSTTQLTSTVWSKTDHATKSGCCERRFFLQSLWVVPCPQ